MNTYNKTPELNKIESLGINLQVFNPRFFTFSNMIYFGLSRSLAFLYVL